MRNVGIMMISDVQCIMGFPRWRRPCQYV